jgi:hypothetical protein
LESGALDSWLSRERLLCGADFRSLKFRSWPGAECWLSTCDGLSQRVSRAIVTARVLPGNARGSAIAEIA